MPLARSNLRTLQLVLAVVLVGLALVVVFVVIDIRKEHPRNSEFFVWALGLKGVEAKEIADCTTGSWASLDSADFYVGELHERGLRVPMSGYPHNLPFQADWTMVHWTRGPASDQDKRIIKEGSEFAIGWLQQEGKCRAAREMLLSVPAITERPDIWYSYAYKDDPYLNRFSLYVIDPATKVFYLLRFGI